MHSQSRYQERVSIAFPVRGCFLLLLHCVHCLLVFGFLPVVPVVFASLYFCGCVGWSGIRSGDRDKVIYRVCYYYSILPID